MRLLQVLEERLLLLSLTDQRNLFVVREYSGIKTNKNSLLFRQKLSFESVISPQKVKLDPTLGLKILLKYLWGNFQTEDSETSF